MTVISKSPDKQHLAVGYNDGAIRVFELETGECVVNFSGHKSTVTALNYDEDGVRLVSGSKVSTFAPGNEFIRSFQHKFAFDP